MGLALNDDIWMRRSISLLWVAEILATVCPPASGEPATIPAPPCGGLARNRIVTGERCSPRRGPAGERHQRPAARRGRGLLERSVYAAIVSY